MICIDLGPTLIVSRYIAKQGFFGYVHCLYQLDFRVTYRSYTQMFLSEEIYYLSKRKNNFFQVAYCEEIWYFITHLTDLAGKIAY